MLGVHIDQERQKFRELGYLVELRNLLLKIRDNRELRQRVERNRKSYLASITIEKFTPTYLKTYTPMLFFRISPSKAR